MKTTPQQTSRRRSVDTAAKAIIKALRAQRNPARAQQTQHYFKEPVTALGVDTPTLRRTVKEHVRPLRKTWILTQAVRCCDRLLQKPEIEIRAAGFMILAAFEKDFTPDLAVRARKWLQQPRLDNWALTDGFCACVLSPLLAAHPAVEKTLCTWSKAESLWLRRAALVTFIPFARKGRCLQRVYCLVRQHFKDPEDLMHKAAGWLLREAGKTDPERLKQFLLRHGPAIPRTTVRYAIERFPKAERAALLKATRK